MSEGTSTLDDVRAAMTSLESESSTEAPPAEAPDTAAAPELAAETPSAAAERVRDEKGRFAAKEAAAETKTPAPATQTATKPPEQPAAAPVQLQPEVQQPQTAAPEMKAPGRWRAPAREVWAQVPKAVQEEVWKRERETAVALQETAETRKQYAAYREVVTPFENAIRANGGDPLRTIGASLQVFHRLQYGAPEEKAQLVAGLTKRFGVSVEALDAALAGAAPAGGAPAAMDSTSLKAQLKQELMRDFMSQRQETEKANAARELQAIEADPAYEFMVDEAYMEDIRARMSGQLQAAADLGRVMTLKDAYEAACWANPGVRAILQQREAAKAAQANVASTQRAVKAAGSVKSSPVVQGNGVAKGGKGNTKDDVAAAFAELEAAS